MRVYIEVSDYGRALCAYFLDKRSSVSGAVMDHVAHIEVTWTPVQECEVMEPTIRVPIALGTSVAKAVVDELRRARITDPVPQSPTDDAVKAMLAHIGDLRELLGLDRRGVRQLTVGERNYGDVEDPADAG